MKPLESLRNSRAGATAYVIGNAPSLSTLDMGELMRRQSFFVNGAFLEARRRKVAFAPPYYMVSDSDFLDRHRHEVLEAKATCAVFFRMNVWTRAGRPEAVIPVPFHLRPTMNQGHFQTDAPEGVYRGFTVVLDCIQLAYFMGFARVLIGGVDLTHAEYSYAYEDPPSILPISHAAASFRVALKRFSEADRVLAKITPSPNLPLPFIPSELAE